VAFEAKGKRRQPLTVPEQSPEDTRLVARHMPLAPELMGRMIHPASQRARQEQVGFDR